MHKYLEESFKYKKVHEKNERAKEIREFGGSLTTKHMAKIYPAKKKFGNNAIIYKSKQRKKNLESNGQDRSTLSNLSNY
jgi:hypothetical protein